MTRIQPPVCPRCLRRHWELMSTTAAALHVHVRIERFRKAVEEGTGPQPWAHEMYVHPRYHVTELDRWLTATTQSSNAA